MHSVHTYMPKETPDPTTLPPQCTLPPSPPNDYTDDNDEDAVDGDDDDDDDVSATSSRASRPAPHARTQFPRLQLRV